MGRVASNDDLQKQIDDLNADKLKVISTIAEVRLMADDYEVAYTPKQRMQTIRKNIDKKIDGFIKGFKAIQYKTRSSEEILEEFNNEQGDAYNEIELLRSNIDAKNGEIYSIDDAVKDSEAAVQFNDIEVQRVDRDNKAKLAAFAGQLTALNSGIIDLTRRPDETDEEYRQRCYN